LEIFLRAQRGMAFHIQTIIFKVVAKKRLFDDRNLEKRISPKSGYLQTEFLS